MTAAKQAKVAKRQVGGETPVVRFPQRAPVQQDRGNRECHAVKMTTNGGKSSKLLQAMWTKKQKLERSERGWEEQSRARGDQKGILKVRVKLFCSLMAYFPSL